MSTRTPPEPTLEEKMKMTTAFGSFLHYGSMTLLVACPVLIAIPPRKLDLYTFSLAGLMFASTNQLVKEKTGASLWYKLPGTRLPPQAISYQDQQTGRRLLDEVPEPQAPSISQQIQSQPSILEQADDWKAQRLREEQKKIDEGQGYWDMITSQVWEVWNQEHKKVDEIKSIDERVVKDREIKSLRDVEFAQAGASDSAARKGK